MDRTNIIAQKALTLTGSLLGMQRVKIKIIIIMVITAPPVNHVGRDYNNIIIILAAHQIVHVLHMIQYIHNNIISLVILMKYNVPILEYII